MAAPTCEDLIPAILAYAPTNCTWLVGQALQRAVARGESWMPWLVLWPQSNAYSWAPSATTAMRRAISTGGETWNVGEVVSGLLDRIEWSGTLKG